MIKSIRHNLALKLDSIGFIASTLCAIHCAAMPFVLIFLTMSGLNFIVDPIFEIIFISTSILIGVFTFRHGYFNHHKQIYPFIIFLSGLLIVVLGHYFFHAHSHEASTNPGYGYNENVFLFVITPVGAFIIAISHLVNRRLSRSPDVCCEEASTPAKIAEQNS